MAQYGNPSSGNTAPSSGFFHDDSGNSQYCSEFGSWPGGVVTEVHVYVAGDLAATNIQLCLWSHGNNLLWSSASHTLNSGTEVIGGQAWVVITGINLYVGPGTGLKIGFQSDGNVVWTFENSGSVQYHHGPTAPTDFVVGGTEGGGSLGAYVVYNPVSAPTISNISPAVGTTGTQTTITGTQFTYASAVTINGAAASFTVNSDTQITATVPAGSTPGAGTVQVTNPAGSASSAFTVGQIYFGDVSGSGAVHSIVAVWYGKDNGDGTVTPTKVVGVWVPNGAGVKRVW